MLATKYNAESNLQSKVKIVESPPLCPPPIPTPEGPDNVKVKLDPIKQAKISACEIR